MSKFIVPFLIMFAVVVPAHAQLRVNVGAGATSSVQGETLKLNADGSVSATAQASSTASVEGMPRNSLGAEIRTALDVITEDDLDAFEENILVLNPKIEDADSSNKRVAVSYWHEGRFLGIFPVKVQSRTDAEIGEEDTLTVTTHVPWWSFLVFGMGNVQGDVQVKLQSEGQFSSDVLNREDAAARARAIETIVSAHAGVAK